MLEYSKCYAMQILINESQIYLENLNLVSLGRDLESRALKNDGSSSSFWLDLNEWTCLRMNFHKISLNHNWEGNGLSIIY